jgi:hypothetical protein
LDCHTATLAGRGADAPLGGILNSRNAVEWFLHPVPVEGVASEAVKMPGEVWAGASDEVHVHCMPLCDQPFQGFAHGHDVVKDQKVGDEVVVFDELALLVANPFGGQRAAAEGDPLEELIETFTVNCK